uniref:Uncharacterized protein n=1 Tax=Knipowitschia caucasica TaxID=637954 RepID=A0AAV2M5L7_KNICA
MAHQCHSNTLFTQLLISRNCIPLCKRIKSIPHRTEPDRTDHKHIEPCTCSYDLFLVFMREEAGGEERRREERGVGGRGVRGVGGEERGVGEGEEREEFVL